MNLRDLEYVVTIAELGSFARAAEACHVSQSTLSIQLKKLEEFLGVMLFERSHREVRVTQAGEDIVASARRIVQESKELVALAKESRDPFSGELRLGVFPTLAPYFLPRAVQRMKRAYPDITPFLIEEKSPVLIDRLQTGKIDAALLALPVQGTGLSQASLFDDEFLLACHASHPLAKRKRVRSNDLKHENLLLLEDGHCLRDQALEVCTLTGAREHPEFRATSLETLRHMVAAGVGVTLIPKMAARPTPQLAYVPFSGKHPPSRRIGLIWRTGSPRRALMEGLAALLKEAGKKKE